MHGLGTTEGYPFSYILINKQTEEILGNATTKPRYAYTYSNKYYILAESLANWLKPEAGRCPLLLLVAHWLPFAHLPRNKN